MGVDAARSTHEEDAGFCSVLDPEDHLCGSVLSVLNLSSGAEQGPQGSSI